MKKTILRLLGISAVTYGLIVVAMYFMQSSLLYNPGERMPDPVALGVPDITVVPLVAEDGAEIYGWYQPAQQGKRTILYVHGNAGDVGSQLALTKDLMDAGYGVLMVEYRGFGGNPGTPTEKGLYADARAGLNHLRALGLNDSDIVLYGRSLGTGVMTKIATEVDAAGIILQAPYTTIPDVGQVHYPWLPVKLVSREKYDSLGRIKDVTEPLFMYYGDADRTVPPQFSAELFEAANQPKERVIIPGGGHSNIFDVGGNAAVLEWLSRYGAVSTD